MNLLESNVSESRKALDLQASEQTIYVLKKVKAIYSIAVHQNAIHQNAFFPAAHNE